METRGLLLTGDTSGDGVSGTTAYVVLIRARVKAGFESTALQQGRELSPSGEGRVVVPVQLPVPTARRLDWRFPCPTANLRF